MLKILCPTDFSAASFQACQFALDHYRDLDCTIHLLHCIYHKGKTSLLLKMDDIYKQYAIQDLKERVDSSFSPDEKKKIEIGVFKGDPERFIPSYADYHDFDLVCIGQKRDRIWKKLIGRNIIRRTLRRIDRPTWIIQQDYHKTEVKRIMTVVDDLNQIEVTIDAIERFRNRIPAEVCMSLPKDYEVDILKQRVVTKQVHFIYDEQIRDGLMQKSDSVTIVDQCRENQAQALGLIYRSQRWWRRILRPNYSQYILGKVQIPILFLPSLKGVGSQDI